MTIIIKYFGQLAEITNCEEETFQSSNDLISSVLEQLFLKYPQLKEQDFKVAQNQELVSTDAKIIGTELALLPPFAGG